LLVGIRCISNDKKATAARFLQAGCQKICFFVFILNRFAMNRSLYIPIITCFILLAKILPAQTGICSQVIASSGKSTTVGGRSYAYTIGEPFIFTLSANSNKITQGFHQPDLCLPVLTNDLDLNAWKLEIYPNPATSLIHIRYSSEQKGQLSAQVFDLLGRTIVQDFPVNNPDDTQMDCTTWQAGVYLVRLQDLRTQSSATVRIVRL